MKQLIAPALLAAALTLSGCAQTAAAPVQAPSPGTVQMQNLTAAILKINPVLANAKTVDAVTGICSSILEGSSDDDLLKVARARFADPHTPEVTADQSKALVAAIKANGFCAKPGK